MIRPLSLIVLLTVASCCYGQSFFYDDKYFDNDLLFEAGLTLGIMNSVTDVGQKKGSPISPAYYDWKSTQLNTGIYFAAMYKSIVEGRAELTYGAIAGKDANSDSRFVQSRNLNYKSKIFELSLVTAFHPIMLFNTETLPVVSPYIMLGVGVFSYYPKTLYNDEWIPLRKMNTEGQNSEQYPARKQYNLRAVSMPIGGGLKYEYNARFNFRFEALYRYTSSDYLDDVSLNYVNRNIFPTEIQKILSHRYRELNPRVDRTGLRRGTGQAKDQFFTISFKAGYVLGREKIRK
jgi:hypothetical protein